MHYLAQFEYHNPYTDNPKFLYIYIYNNLLIFI